MRVIVFALTVLVGLSANVFGQSFNNLPAATVPLSGAENVPMTQGTGCALNIAPCVTAQAPSAQVGVPLVMGTGCSSILAPFLYQECLDTSGSPVVLKQWFNGVWNQIYALTSSGVAILVPVSNLTSPFFVAGTSVSTSGTQLGYLSSVTGTTGSAASNLVFSSGPSLSTPTLTTPTITNPTISGTETNSATGTYSGSNTFTGAVSMTSLSVSKGVSGTLSGHVASLAVLQASCFSSSGCTVGNPVFPNGVTRDDYAVGNGAPPLFFHGETGTCASNSRTNDGGTCVNTTGGDGNSFYSVSLGSVFNALEFGFVSSASAATNNTAIQSALNAAGATLGTVVIPQQASVNPFLYVPSGVTVRCGGENLPLTRAQAGPLFVTVDVVGNTYPIGTAQSPVFDSCYVNNNQLAGTGFLIASAGNWLMTNIGSTNSKDAAEFTISGISAGSMTVSATQRGTINHGDMVICAGCSVISGTATSGTASGTTLHFSGGPPAGTAIGQLVTDCGGVALSTPCLAVLADIPADTYVTAVSGTTVTLSQGVGGSGVSTNDVITFSGNTFPVIQNNSSPFTLSMAVNVATAEEAATSTPWVWTNGPPAASCNQNSVNYPVCNPQFPTADVSILGGSLPGQWNTGLLGGTFSGSCPSQFSSIGLYMDSYQSDGLQKPNANTITNVEALCANVGRVIANGSNNTFIQFLHQNDVIGMILGTGAANANDNIDTNAYFEGPVTVNMQKVAIYDQQASQNTCQILGSLGRVNGPPYSQYLGTYNACGQDTYTVTMNCNSGSPAGYTHRTGTFSWENYNLTLNINLLLSGAGTCSAPVTISMPPGFGVGNLTAVPAVDFTSQALMSAFISSSSIANSVIALRTAAGDTGITLTDQYTLSGVLQTPVN